MLLLISAKTTQLQAMTIKQQPGLILQATTMKDGRGLADRNVPPDCDLVRL